MENKFTTKETKELLVLLFKLGNGFKLATADKKIDLADAGLFFAAIPAMGAAFEGIGQIPAELKDLNAEEFAELEAYLVKEIGIVVAKEELLKQINAGLKLGHAMYDFYNSIK